MEVSAVDTANSDKLNLILPLDWIIQDDWRWTLVIALLICPLVPLLVMGPLLESRWVPINRYDQFYAFWPGNLLLAGFVAGSSGVIGTLPDGWRQATWQNVVFLCVGIALWVGLTIMDFGPYGRRQMLSPTKIYHNSLYFWYCYVVMSVGFPMYAAPVHWVAKFWVSIPLLVWFACLYKDATMPKEELLHKASVAHDEDWHVLGSRGRFRIRRYNPEQCVYQ